MKLQNLSRHIFFGLALPAMALLSTACKSGSSGSGDNGEFAAGVDLNGTWNVTTRVTATSGNSGDVVGETDNDQVSITVSGSTLVVDAGTPDQLVGTLNRRNWSASRNDSGVTFTVNIAFNAFGTTFSGTAVVREVQSGFEVFSTTLSVNGTKASAPGPGPSGSLTVTLQWTSDADLDMDVQEPNGSFCSSFNTAGNPSSGGGVHSGDANPNCQVTNPASLERVTYSSREAGTYRAFYDFFTSCAQGNLGTFTFSAVGAGLSGTTSRTSAVTDTLDETAEFSAN